VRTIGKHRGRRSSCREMIRKNREEGKNETNNKKSGPSKRKVSGGTVRGRALPRGEA